MLQHLGGEGQVLQLQAGGEDHVRGGQHVLGAVQADRQVDAVGRRREVDGLAVGLGEQDARVGLAGGLGEPLLQVVLEYPPGCRARLGELVLGPLRGPTAAVGLPVGPADEVEDVLPEHRHPPGLDVEDVVPGVAVPVVGDPGGAVVGAPLQQDDLDRAAGEVEHPDRGGGAGQAGSHHDDPGTGDCSTHAEAFRSRGRNREPGARHHPPRPGTGPPTECARAVRGSG